jgi:hypothetical protein
MDEVHVGLVGGSRGRRGIASVARRCECRRRNPRRGNSPSPAFSTIAAVCANINCVEAQKPRPPIDLDTAAVDLPPKQGSMLGARDGRLGGVASPGDWSDVLIHGLSNHLDDPCCYFRDAKIPCWKAQVMDLDKSASASPGWCGCAPTTPPATRTT